jgi:uncharacterized membrane protein required for colicin V production
MGIVGALIHLAAIIFSFFLVSHFYPAVRYGLMAKLNTAPLLANIAAILLIIIVILVLVQLVIFAIERLLGYMHLSFLNHALGGLFGLVAGLVLVIILSVMIDYFPSISEKLADSEKHRVYSGVIVAKEEMFSTFKLKAQDRLVEYIQERAAAETEKILSTDKK